MKKEEKHEIWKEKEEIKPKKQKHPLGWKSILSIFVVLMVVTLVVVYTSSELTGSVIKQDQQLKGTAGASTDNVSFDLVAQKTPLVEVEKAVYFTEYKETQDQLLKASKDLIQCESSIRENELKYGYEIDLLGLKIAKLSSDNQNGQKKEASVCQDTNTKYDNLVVEYNTFVAYAAKSICCKKKVDNSLINSYLVSDGTLNCLESGGTELVC